jgi:Tol biopolymer transport system component
MNREFWVGLPVSKHPHVVKLTLLVWLCLSLGAIAGEPRRLAFERDGAIWISTLAGAKPRKIARGSDPDLSPDGLHVAFTTSKTAPPDFTRQIAVVDLVSGKTQVLERLPSDNCYGAYWSKEGRLYCSVFHEDRWKIGIFEADGSAFRFLPEPKHDGPWFSPGCWSSDGRSIFCQNLESIWQIQLDGTVLGQWDLASRTVAAGLNCGTALASSPDDSSVLVEVEVLAGPDAKDSPALLQINLVTNQARRIKPGGRRAMSPRWLNDHEIIFVSGGKAGTAAGIYRAEIGSGQRRLIMENGRSPSVSRE